MPLLDLISSGCVSSMITSSSSSSLSGCFCCSFPVSIALASWLSFVLLCFCARVRLLGFSAFFDSPFPVVVFFNSLFSSSSDRRSHSFRFSPWCVLFLFFSLVFMCVSSSFTSSTSFSSASSSPPPSSSSVRICTFFWFCSC